jgi:PAS domain S-box-containing protein
MKSHIESGPAKRNSLKPRLSEKAPPARAKFDEIVRAISTRFIALAPEEIDKGIQGALAKIGRFTGVDRGYICLLRDSHLDNTHEWCAKGVPPKKDDLQDLPVQSFSWLMARLRRQESVQLSHLSDLPERAESEKEIFAALGIQSLIAAPMLLRNTLVGFLGFDSIRKGKNWPEDSGDLLKVVGDIFANALERKQAYEVQKKSEEHYRQLVENSPAGICVVQNHVLKFCNKGFSAIFGYDNTAELIGTRLLRLVAREHRELVNTQLKIRESRRKAASRYEFSGVRKDGTVIDAEFLGADIIVEGQPAVLGTVTDITERKRAEGKVIWVQDNVQPVFDSKGRLIYYDGSSLDITRQKREEEATKNRSDQVIRHQAALLELAKLNSSDLSSAVRKITEITARTLDVDRVSIWFFNPEHTVIICHDLYQKSQDTHDKGLMLEAREYPRYFRALEESCIIAADDTLTDPRTSEFAESYLRPLRISSMMDVPIRLRGEVIGIICNEVIGPLRKWSLEGQQFAIAIGDIVALALEASERKRMEKVNESILRISEATNSSKNLDELFHSIHQVISNLMPANNFYIALYDPQTDTVSFPYFIDEFDLPPAPKKPGRGLTDYVLRTGKPLLASPEVFSQLEKRGEVESIGAPSIDWLGVPLITDGKTIGILVVQTYTEGVRYGEEEKNILKFVSDQVAMAVRRKKTEEEAQERERFLESVFESIQDGLSILGEDCSIIRVNPAMEKWYAHAMPLVGKKCYQAYHLRDECCTVCPTRRTLQTSQTSFEIVPKIGTGGELTGWLDLYSFPLIDQKTGQMKGVIEYVRDITERKEAQDKLQSSLSEKEVLLREIHHRVKNNMQVISSLLNLQSRHISDADVLEIFKESQRRIRSMALIHEHLYQSSDLSRIEFSQYLQNLATHLFHSCQVDSDRVRLTMDTEEIFLNINTAIPCGLIVNELVSNALKHAFPDGRKGEVAIELHRVVGDGYVLRVKDDGVGFPEGLDFRRTDTLGMQIIITLVGQIEASIELRRENGTEFKILFQEVKYKQRT